MSLDRSLSSLLHEVLSKSNTDDDPSTSDDGLVGHCLRESITYRLPESAKTDRLIGFRMMKRCLTKISNPGEIIGQPSEALIIQGNSNNHERIRQYIAFQSGEKNPCFFGKESAPLKGQVLSNSDLKALKKTYLKIAVQCLFKKDRQHRAIWPWAALEAWSLLTYVKEHNVSKAFDFSPYLIDANWYSQLLMKEGVQVWRVPSSGPLKAHNRFMIGDAATFSTPYHFMEKDKFQETIRPKHIYKWVPEQSMNYMDLYVKNPRTAQLNTIGFYSHASWVRKAEGHSDNGLNIHEGEANLLGHLSKILTDKPELKLKIFLHPRERKAEIFERTKAYYQEQFASTKYEFSDPNTPSSNAFDEADIGIAVYSTILYERLFCGFKSLIGNYGMTDFPDPDSSLANICFQSYEALKDKIEQVSTLSNLQFFSEMGLEGYRFNTYPIVQDKYPESL